jgi:hypothetical protein
MSSVKCSLSLGIIDLSVIKIALAMYDRGGDLINFGGAFSTPMTKNSAVILCLPQTRPLKVFSLSKIRLFSG